MIMIIAIICNYGTTKKQNTFMCLHVHMQEVHARRMRYGYRYTWVLSVRHVVAIYCDILGKFTIFKTKQWQ